MAADTLTLPCLIHSMIMSSPDEDFKMLKFGSLGSANEKVQVIKHLQNNNKYTNLIDFSVYHLLQFMNSNYYNYTTMCSECIKLH